MRMNQPFRLLVLGLCALACGCSSTPGSSSVTAREARVLDKAEIRELRAGGSDELALVAELNGYPDPAIVLQLRDKLALTPDQRFEITRLHSMTQGKARALGERIVIAEDDFDYFMAAAKQPQDSIRAQLDRIAGLRAALRGLHIEAHMKTWEALTEDQRQLYRELRDLPPPKKEAPPEENSVPQTPLY